MCHGYAQKTEEEVEALGEPGLLHGCPDLNCTIALSHGPISLPRPPALPPSPQVMDGRAHTSPPLDRQLQYDR